MVPASNRPQFVIGYRGRTRTPICLAQSTETAVKHNDVDYSIAEDKAHPYLWRYSIYPRAMPGKLPTIVTSIGYSTHSDAEAACKQEIDRSLAGARRT